MAKLRRSLDNAIASVASRVLAAVPHDPIALLEQDHRVLERLFARGEKTTERAARVPL